MRLRTLVRQVHMYLALVMGLPLAVVGLSGAAIGAADLVYGSSPTARRVEAVGTIQPLGELLRVATAAFPAHPAAGVAMPQRPDLAYDIALRDGRRVLVDPYTATVVDSLYLAGTFRRYAFQVHASLMAGPTGKTIVGISTLVSIPLAISGLVLWWPRTRWTQGLTIGWRASWKRLNYDLHSTVGFYSSLVLLLLAASGAIIAYDGVAKAWLGGEDMRGTTYESIVVPGVTKIAPSDALRIADAALPGARTTWLGIPQNPRGVYAVFKKYPEDPSPGMSRVFVDQFSGAVLGVKSTRGAHVGQRVLDLNFPVHTGRILGVPGQVLALVVSALLSAQLVTGALIWWQRRRRRAAPALDTVRAGNRKRA